MKKLIYYILLVTFVSAASVKAESYTLKQFLENVKAHNKEIKLANEDLKFAQATKREAIAGALPSISSSAGYNRNLSSNYLFVDLGEEKSRLKLTKNNEYRLNVTLDQTLFSGAVYNAIRAANEYEKLTEYMFQASENEIIILAKKYFYQALLLEKVHEVSVQAETNARENFNNTANAFDFGLKSEFDKLQAEVRYLELVPQTTASERNLKVALMNLKSMSGINLQESFHPNGSLESYPAIPEEISFANILNQRPDFKAMLWDEKLKATGVRIEKATRIPTLSGYLSYNYSAQSDEFRFDDENNSYTVGLNLSLPIFTGGRTSAKIKKAQIAVNRSQINIERATDNIQTETLKIRLRLNEAHGRIESAKAAFSTATKAFEIAEATSRAGLTTQLELKDSRVVLDQTKVGFYSAIYDFYDAYFDWEKAVGQIEGYDR